MNILDIIKNMPAGRELYTTVYGPVTVSHIDYSVTASHIDYSKEAYIILKDENGQELTVNTEGKISRSGECILLPRKGHKSWQYWQPLIQKGDFVVNTAGNVGFILKEINEYTTNLTILYSNGIAYHTGYENIKGWADSVQIKEFKKDLHEAGYVIENDECKKIEPLTEGEFIRYENIPYLIMKVKDGQLHLMNDKGERRILQYTPNMKEDTTVQMDKFKETLKHNVFPLACDEKYKENVVTLKFMKCMVSFGKFKKGKTYWFEYIGDDKYLGRSDNILNQKIQILPPQMDYFISCEDKFLQNLIDWSLDHYKTIVNEDQRELEQFVFGPVMHETQEQKETRFMIQHCKELRKLMNGPEFDPDPVIEKIRKADKEDKIVYTYENSLATVSLATVSLDKFIEQFIDGQLYDLNLDEAVLFTLLKNGKITAINKIAINRLIKRLYNIIDDYKEKCGEKRSSKINRQMNWPSQQPEETEPGNVDC